MSGSTEPAVLAKATTADGIAIEELARKVLKSVLAKSVDEKREYGGVIHRDRTTRKLGHTGPFRGYAQANVDVGQNQPNLGCKPGTVPVAWYHTHPVKEHVSVHDGKVIHIAMGWDQFVEGDLDVSERNNIVGYVATFDRRLWRYTPPPMTMILGRWTSEVGALGSWGPLNGTL